MMFHIIQILNICQLPCWASANPPGSPVPSRSGSRHWVQVPFAPHLRPGGISWDLMGHGCHWSCPASSELPHLQPWSYPRILHPKAAGCGARERASSGQTRWMRNNVINGFNGLLDANCIAATVAMFCNFDVFINLLFGCGRWAAGLNMSLAKKPSELIGQRWVQVKCPQLIRSLRMPALPCLTQLSNAPSSRLLGKSVFL